MSTATMVDIPQTLIRLIENERKRAEFLYVLAISSARAGQQEVAKGYGRECVKLLRQIGQSTYEDCATDMTVVDGVAMPEFLHEKVVFDRLWQCGIRWEDEIGLEDDTEPDTREEV